MNIVVNLEVSQTSSKIELELEDLNLTKEQFLEFSQDERDEIIQDWIDENYTYNDPCWCVDKVDFC
jgi:hypothetical protein